MATKKSGSTKTKKQNKGKRTYTKKAQKQEEMRKALFFDEILLILTFIISLLLILSNFDLSGSVGKVINNVTFGLIGFLGYFLPFYLFWAMAFYIANRGNKVVRRKVISSIIIIITLSALIQLITTKNSIDTISSYYKISSANKSGGGVLGGIIVNIFHPLFGTVGSYVIITGILFISLMFITGKALFTYLSKKSRNRMIELREEQRQRREQKQANLDNTDSNSIKRKKPKTFLLNGKLAKVKEEKKENSSEIEIDSQSGKDKKPASIFSMKEIRPENVEFPIYRAQSYEGEANLTDDGMGQIDKLENSNRSYYGKSMEDQELQEVETSLETDNNTKNNQNDKTNYNQTVEKQKHVKSSTESGEIEKLELDQSVEEEKAYVFPSVNLLSRPKGKGKGLSDKSLKETALKLQNTLKSFGVGVSITNVSCGPSVTRYELQPEHGVKVSRITALSDDIKLNLAASDIRIEAPIPGKAAVGIEVPNKENSVVTFRELLESNEFTKHPSKLAFAVGKDIGGKNIVTDIGKMPHLLIAGATGSGKSVCINTLIMSILYKAKPSEVKLIMVDPKVVELSSYNGVPHLLLPVVTDPKKAAAALNWAVVEMTDRYKKFADLGVRDLNGYNEKVSKVEKDNDKEYQKLPQIVIIVDELADLMMVAPGEVEDAICRLAQMARAAGLHLIIATQRPSVNVITGLIKANIPSRIAFSVSSAVDSRTIIDGSGAEKLLGKGDMLFFPSGYAKPVRVQGAFISDKEVSKVVEFLSDENSGMNYNEEIAEKIVNTKVVSGNTSSEDTERDEYFAEAGKFIIEKDKASIGMLQRVYRIGFNRAARIMDQLAEVGAVGPEEGTKPRKVLMTAEEFEQYLENNS